MCVDDYDDKNVSDVFQSGTFLIEKILSSS